MITLYLPDRDNGITAANIAVDVFSPNGEIRADLLVLPGWNFSRTRWQKETDLLKFCEKYQFRCVFPEMGVTLYESSYFPETKLKWSFLPGGQWIQKVFFPQMQKRGIFGDKDRNLILGLSTGGRGVALLSLQNPGTFKAGASLSGDYDQIRMTHDNLMKALYGDYERFSRRWQSLDNPETEAQKNRWKMPIYIGHGKKDKVVPFEQSRLFYETLKQKNPGIQVIFSQPENAGHDFPFWNSQLKGVFDFFERFLTL